LNNLDNLVWEAASIVATAAAFFGSGFGGELTIVLSVVLASTINLFDPSQFLWQFLVVSFTKFMVSLLFCFLFPFSFRII